MSFDEIYQAYVDTVYGFLMFKLRDEHLVEDILQETFLAVYQNTDNFKKISSPKAWILSIAHNKMVDHLRKGYENEHSLVTELVAGENHDFSNNLFLQEAFGQLEDTARTILYGLYVEGLSYQELSLILDIPEGTVKSKAHYARKKLRHWLQEGSK